MVAGLLVCTSFAVPAVQAAPDKAADGLLETTIPYTQQKSAEHEDGNYFTFSTGKGDWALGQAGTEKHVWSRDPASEEDAKSIWYEVKFDGSAIDVYSGKNHPMGFAKYTVTTASGETKSKEVSLWNGKNVESTLVATFKNLGEGTHTLRVEATGKRDERSKTNQECIDCAEVVVRHEPYEPTKLEASKESVKLTLNETDETEIKLTTEPDYVSDEDLTFTSKDPKIAEVDESGVVTAVSEGSTSIVVAPKAKPAASDAADKADAAAAPQVAKPIEIPVTVNFVAPNMDGFISDVDTQWTQDRYDDAIAEIEKLDNEGGAREKRSADAPQDTEKLTAWKNDTAISEITLATKGTPARDVTVEATAFTGDAGTIDAKNVEVSFIGSTKAYTGWLGYGNNPGRLPADDGKNRAESNDILLGSDPVDVRSDDLQNIFVKVKVPKDTKAGVYSGAIKVSAKGMAEPLEFRYELTVKDAQLPDASEFGKTFDVELWQYPYSSAEYYGVEPFSDEHFKILQSIMDLYEGMGGHAITTTVTEDAWQGQTYADDSSAGHNEKVHYPSMVKWQMDASGIMTYDFTDFDKWVQFNLDNGIGDKIILYSVAPWPAEITYWKQGADGKETLVHEDYGTPQTGNFDSDAAKANYHKRMRHFLTAMIKHLEEKGWFDRAYVGIDEKTFSTEAFDLIDSVTNSKGEALKTAGAMDHIDNVEIAMRVDDLNIGDYIPYTKSAEFKKLLQMRDDAGLRTTLYSCTEHAPGNFSLSSPVESYWSMINAGKQGTSGFLRWAYDAWVDDPLTDASHWSFEPGDCFLVYPGATKAEVEAGNLTDDQLEARSSVRLERMAEGVRDVNKMMLMTSQVTELEDEATKLYEKVQTPGYYDGAHKYLPKEKVKQLDGEVDQFKQGLDALTDVYISKVKSGTVKPTGIEVTGGNSPIKVGTTEKFTATTKPADALAKGVTWSSSNPDIATVATDGTVTAKKAGVTTITATSTVDGKVKGSKKVVVGGKVEIAAEDKVAHYSFEGNANDDWTGDATARAAGAGEQNGTVNKADFVDGKLGKAVSVDADKGMTVTIPDGAFPALDGDKAWTVGYWVQSTEPLDKQSLPLMDASGEWAFALRLADGDKRKAPGFRVSKSDGGVLTFGNHGLFEANKWYRVTWTNDPNAGLSMYVNGERVDDVNNWTATDANVKNMKFPVEIIGGSGFTGLIDELAVYDRVLTPAEVKAQLSEFSPAGEQSGALGLETAEKTIYEGQSFGISGNFDADASFKVTKTENVADDAKKIEDHDVVTVSEDGVVHGDLRGEATIQVTSGGKTDKMTVRVKRNVSASSQVPYYVLDEKYQSDVYGPEEMKADGVYDNKDKRYYGQPDMVRTATGRLITAYPAGHGVGAIHMRYSDDNGASWHDVEKTPKGWEQSRETPTLYTLKMDGGKERIMMITGCPVWSNDNKMRGWQTSYSDDNGVTWTDYKNWWPNMEESQSSAQNPAVVAMASLVQLHDENGKPMQKWMGVYHHQTGDFTNYKTYLTFDDKGNEQWSKPEPLLPDSHDVEKERQLCEIGMFRSPDGKRIVGLCRAQSHNAPSTMIYSDDEGKTWSDPIDLPGSLAGERHKAMFDPVTGLLLITFRGIQFDTDFDNKFEGSNDWTCGDWEMWVGTYDQLMNQEEGFFRMQLDEDFSKTPKSGDTGYTGLTVDADGTFVMDSYGHWDKSFSESWSDPATGGYNVYTDLSWIRQAKFNLKDMLTEMGLMTDQLPVNAKVIFDFNYDGAPAAEVKTVAAGTQLQAVAPAAPAREGFTFTGWFTDAAATQAQDMSTGVGSNLTLYAGWKKNESPIGPEKPTDPPVPEEGDGNPGEAKPNRPNKPNGALPSTGDDVLFYVGGAAVLAVVLVAAGVLLRKRRS